MESKETSAVANEFLNLADEEKNPISNLKLIKLMYIAQGLSLSLLDKPLFPDPIEAWKYGPVIPSIYYEFRQFGKDPINKQSVTLSKYGQPRVVNRLSDLEKKRIVELTWELYGDVDAKELINLTHRRGTPWFFTYNPETKNERINNKVIKNYYDQIVEKLDEKLMGLKN